MSIRTLLTAITLLIVTPLAHAQAQNAFSPDRPGLGDGPFITEPRFTYLETGIEYYEGGSVDQFSFGQVLFRHGLSPGLEARVQVNSFIIETRPLENETGVPDPSVGLKFSLMQRSESGLKISGMTSVSIPAGYSPYTDNKWHPSATLIADYKLSEYRDWNVTANLGYTAGPSETSDLYTLTVTPEFSIVDTNYGVYFGYAAFLQEDYNQHFVEAGVTNRVAESLQLDLNTGYELNSGDYFLGIGATMHF